MLLAVHQQGIPRKDGRADLLGLEGNVRARSSVLDGDDFTQILLKNVHLVELDGHFEYVNKRELLILGSVTAGLRHTDRAAR